jgi:SPP1 family predicted phage head-tail adaptor
MRSDRNKRIDIQKQTGEQDEYGQPIESFGKSWNETDEWNLTDDKWSLFAANVWASVEPISGKEFFSAEQNNAMTNTRVKIEYSSVTKNIVPGMRVLYGTRKFYILSVIDYKEKHQELQLMCRELV